MFKDKKYSKPESNIKIKFNDKLDNYNPFCKNNHIKSVNFKTSDEISSIYLKTILNIEINNINKKIVYDSRVDKSNIKNNFLDITDIMYTAEEIQTHFLEAKLNLIYHKLTLSNNVDIYNIFVEVEDIYSNYRFTHQFQWCIDLLYIKNTPEKWFIYLATKIEQV